MLMWWDMKDLTLEYLVQAVKEFPKEFSEPLLCNVTDGKAIGTFLENRFQDYLEEKYRFERGNSANGLDLPELEIDIKTTKIGSSQSSAPFHSAKQKVFGLGYSLLVFRYEKINEKFIIHECLFIPKEETADAQLSFRLKQIIDSVGGEQELVDCMLADSIPAEKDEVIEIAQEIVRGKPIIVGTLTLSDARQWRIQYGKCDRLLPNKHYRIS